MGTEIEGDEGNLPTPPTINTKSDFVAAYDKLVLQAKDENIRNRRRDILKVPTLVFLRKVEPGAKLCPVVREVLHHNASETGKWEAGRAMDMCRTLEELVLRLWDQPWRKEFHVLKLYSGFFRTTVTESWTDADRLLELAGYTMDLTGHHQMVLHQAPTQQPVLTAASELYLLGLECQIYREILCLVQAEGFSMAHIAQCRASIACNNEQAARWIRDHCKSATKHRPGKHVRGDDPIYAEIDSPTPSPASSRRSLKSSFSSVNNDTSPSALSTSTSSIQNKEDNDFDKCKPKDPEPIYSVVKKGPKKEVNNNRSTTPTEPPRLYASDGENRPTTNPVVNNSFAKQKSSPTKVIRAQDSGYGSKPTSQELRTIEDGSYVQIDFVPQSPVPQGQVLGQILHGQVQVKTSQGQVQGQIPQGLMTARQISQGKASSLDLQSQVLQGHFHDQVIQGKSCGPDPNVGQYGFDQQGLQALRGSPKANHNMFRPATADEHQMKSLQMLEQCERQTSENQCVLPVTSASKSALAYGGSLRQYKICGSRNEGQVNPVFPADGQSGQVKSDRHSDLTFSTFRPPNQSPQKAKCMATDDNRSSSPYENYGLIEVRPGHTGRPLVTQPSAKPVQVPSAPALDLRMTAESQGYLQKKQSFVECVEKHQSFYDNLPREETDCADIDTDSAEPDKVLQLLEHTKERLETSRAGGMAAPSCYPAQPHMAYTTSVSASQCYYSVPDVGKEPATSQPSKSVTAPIIGISDEFPPPPPHVHMMGNHWQCEACTSFNLQGTEICDICGKSRLKGAEQEPLVSGGPQCPKCTLINDPGTSFCEACNYSFDGGAPTYI